MTQKPNTDRPNTEDAAYQAEKVLNENREVRAAIVSQEPIPEEFKPDFVKLIDFIEAHFDEFMKDKEHQEKKRTAQATPPSTKA